MIIFCFFSRFQMKRLLQIFAFITITVIKWCSAGTPQVHVFFLDDKKQIGYHAGVFGITVDPADQSIYAWAQGYGTVPECQTQQTSVLEAYLLKFNENLTSIIWCQIHRLDGFQTSADHRVGTYDLWSGSNYPAIDPRNGNIFVYGTYWDAQNNSFPCGLFLLKYDRDGNLLSTLLDEKGKGNEVAAGLLLDIDTGNLLAGSTNNTISREIESYLSQFDLETGVLLRKKSMKAFWSKMSPFFPALTAISGHKSIVYCVGFDYWSYSAFLVAVNAHNLILSKQVILMESGTIAYSVSVDPVANAIYAAGSAGNPFFNQRTIWKYRLDTMSREKVVSRGNATGDAYDTFFFSTVHKGTHEVFCGGFSNENRTTLDLMLTSFSANMDVDGMFPLNPSFNSLGFSAAFNSKNMLIIGTSFGYDSSWSMALLGFQAAETQDTVISTTLSLSVPTATETKKIINPGNDGTDPRFPSLMILGVTVAVVSLIIILVLWLIVSLRKRSRFLTAEKSKQHQLQLSRPTLQSYPMYNTTTTANGINTLAVTLPLDVTVFRTSVKELAIPGTYLIQHPDAVSYCRSIGKTANGSLALAAPVSQELIQRSGGRPLAVKQIRVNSGMQMESFYLELSIMYFLKNSPRFVELVGFTIYPSFSIVMIYYPFGSLDAFLYRQKRRVISPTKVLILIFASQIVEAIQIMHQAGFAHCDLKPHNVMIEACSDNQVGYRCRLGDFGLTRPLDDQHRQVKAFNFDSLAGLTVVYAAPEAIMRFRTYSVLSTTSDNYLRCDVYSLGMMLYELSVCCLAWRQ